jgi:two-component system response regulator FlrC
MNLARTVASVPPAASAPRGAAPFPVAESPAMRDVLGAAEDVAVGNTTVLILGESGTGKEVVARYIHRCSPRTSGPWVAVNCAAMPAELLESELFGHERGAFTGAAERRVGKIEQADKGTLLLDEISELPLALQAKLLRVLQEREVDRLGGGRPVPVDVRVIATSNRDLAQMVERKLFRADLYYRLFVFPIVLPPLRDRPADIPVLAIHMLRRLAEELGRETPTLADDALRGLGRYRFPGNVRELGNILERALVRCRYAVIDLQYLDLGVHEPRSSVAALGRSERAPLPDRRFLPEGVPIELGSLERLAIQEALRRENGNRTHAARLLGISLRTLRNKLREYRAGADAAPRQPAAASAGGQILPDLDDESGPIDVGGAPAFAEVPASTAAPAAARTSHLGAGDKEQAA